MTHKFKKDQQYIESLNDENAVLRSKLKRSEAKASSGHAKAKRLWVKQERLRELVARLTDALDGGGA